MQFGRMRLAILSLPLNECQPGKKGFICFVTKYWVEINQMSQRKMEKNLLQFSTGGLPDELAIR